MLKVLMQDISQTGGPSPPRIITYTAKRNIYCHTNKSVQGQTQHY